jgi:hypothetical protein
MAITNSRLPWLIDINVFMTPINHVGWNTNTVNTNCIRNGIKSSNGSQNNEISFDVILAVGTWTIELMHMQQSLCGIYTALIDGISVGTIDGYTASIAYSVRSSVTGVTITSAGKHRLTLRMATKNASSTGYYGQIQHIQLRRTA